MTKFRENDTLLLRILRIGVDIMNAKQRMAAFDKLNRKMRRFFDSYFSELALTGIQAMALHYIIIESAHHDVFSKDLEAYLDIKGASVTSLLNTLEHNGYLTRECLAEDARFKRLALTDKTRAIASDLQEMMDRYIDNIFLGVDEKDLTAFDGVIQQMTHNVSQ